MWHTLVDIARGILLYGLLGTLSVRYPGTVNIEVQQVGTRLYLSNSIVSHGGSPSEGYRTVLIRIIYNIAQGVGHVKIKTPWVVQGKLFCQSIYLSLWVLGFSLYPWSSSWTLESEYYTNS